MAGAGCPAARGKASSPFQPGKVRLPPQYLPALEARAGPHGLPIAVGLHRAADPETGWIRHSRCLTPSEPVEPTACVWPADQPPEAD